MGLSQSEKQPAEASGQFDEACTVFDDDGAKIFHTNGEEREIIVGFSILDRLLLVSFTERLPDQIRIISARKATRKEQNEYEETSATKSRRSSAAKELRNEYRFDYTKARPNRFARRARTKSVVVLLAPDVAKVFKTGESVNEALRAILNAVPRRKPATSSS
jgi:uncharacterized DUF497 family protein